MTRLIGSLHRDDDIICSWFINITDYVQTQSMQFDANLVEARAAASLAREAPDFL
jgi:hypothetical protein